MNKKEKMITAAMLGIGSMFIAQGNEIFATETAVPEYEDSDQDITDTNITIEEPETKEEDHPENPAEPAELPDSPTPPD